MSGPGESPLTIMVIIQNFHHQNHQNLIGTIQERVLIFNIQDNECRFIDPANWTNMWAPRGNARDSVNRDDRQILMTMRMMMRDVE